MTGRATSRRASSGSIAIAALAAVLAASMLAVAASAVLRASLVRLRAMRERRIDSDLAMAAIDDFARDVLLCDSNSFDSLSEPWRVRDADAAAGAASLVTEFPADARFICDDEESRLPLNAETGDALAALIGILTGKPSERCKAIAGEISALRPIPRREFIRRAPSLDIGDYRLLAPFVTAAPTTAVNVNTAARPVLEAVFSAAGRFGTGASSSLSKKLLDLRAAGGYLESLDAPVVDAALGGLNQAEFHALEAVSGTLCVKSRHFSGAAVRGGARIVYTFDREAGAFTRIAVW